MKYMLVILLLLAGITSYSSDKKKEQKAAEITKLVESKQFRFVAQTALPRNGSQIHLTSTYDLEIDSMTIKSWLPYFGRAYHVEYGSTDGGIKFEETAKNIKIKLNEKKQSYLINAEVKTSKDNFRIRMSIGLSGYASLSINSNHKQGITFYGTVETLEE